MKKATFMSAVLLFLSLLLISCNTSNKLTSTGKIQGKLINSLTEDPVIGNFVVNGVEIKTNNLGEFNVDTKVGSLDSNSIKVNIKGFEPIDTEVLSDVKVIKLIPTVGETVTHNGIKVNMRVGIPASALNEMDYFAFIKSKAPKFIQSLGGVDMLNVDFKSLERVISETDTKFPDLTNLTEEELEKISMDFPELDQTLSETKTDEEALAVWSEVENIYNSMKSYVVAKNIINNQDSPKIQKLQYTENGGINTSILGFNVNLQPAEIEVLKSNILYIPGVAAAKMLAEEYAGYYGEDTQDNKLDAIRHVLFSYSTSYEVARITAFSNKDSAIAFSERLGSARECVTTDVLNNFLASGFGEYTNLKATNRMDINNNKVGRDLFDSNTRWETKIEWTTVKINRWIKIKLPLPTATLSTVPPITMAGNIKDKVFNEGIYLTPAIVESTLINRHGLNGYTGKIIYIK